MNDLEWLGLATVVAFVLYVLVGWGMARIDLWREERRIKKEMMK